MEPVPDSGLTPAAEPPPAGDARAKPQLGWKVIPVDAGIEHEQNALQTSSVIERHRPARSWPVDRQQRLDSDPELLVDLPRLRHTGSTSRPRPQAAPPVRSARNLKSVLIPLRHLALPVARLARCPVMVDVSLARWSRGVRVLDGPDRPSFHEVGAA